MEQPSPKTEVTKQVGASPKRAPIAASEDTSDTSNPAIGMISKMKKLAKKIYKIISSHLGLLIILFAYSFIGAAIFQAVEGPNEVKQTNRIHANNNETIIDTLEDILESTWLAFKDNVKDKSDLDLYRELEKILKNYTARYEPEPSMVKWDYWGSMLFCATVYTTIGYGHIAPATSAGQVLTIFYALIGIPLCLVTLASLGRLLTHVVKFQWRFVRRLYYTGQCRKIRRSVPQKAMTIRHSVEDKLDVRSRQISKEEGPMSCLRRFTRFWRRAGRNCWHFCWDCITCHRGNQKHDTVNQDEHHDNALQVPGNDDDEIASYVSIVDENVDEFNLPPLVAITVTIIYIFIGTTMYSFWEQWSFLEAFYFIFVSISTIGFGDVLPAHTKYFLASSIYILFGLALVAMVINVIMVVVIDTIKKAKDTFQQAADQIDKAADMAKEAVMDVGQKIGISRSTASLDKMADEEDEKASAIAKSHDRSVSLPASAFPPGHVV